MKFLQLVVCCVVAVWVAIIAQQWLRRWFWSNSSGGFAFRKSYVDHADLG